MTKAVLVEGVCEIGGPLNDPDIVSEATRIWALLSELARATAFYRGIAMHIHRTKQVLVKVRCVEQMLSHPQSPLVLIVEDYHETPVTLDAILTETLPNIQCAGNAADALCILDEAPPDIVLLDCHLPNGGMCEILAKADTVGSRVVLMSAHPALLEEFSVFGYPCLRKPFCLQDLTAPVERALGELSPQVTVGWSTCSQRPGLATPYRITSSRKFSKYAP